ncbi:exo-beta-N-acetylmuramidase NamZ domain-containing protein [Polaribacter sejongensis]|uniref:exo-beta-N-acetylmuramidase NamZ family protein n=1 Tax=Polaribacter sejongensis TaxID=985043 RepID=UPI0035A6C921
MGVVANQTSVIFKGDSNIHLVDSLVSLGVDVTKVFAPEHGFRGKADAGEHVEDGIDATTGLPIISLYGANRKPSHEHLKGLDVMLFDIQDVGVRFYTYISTLHNVMEVCAELNIPLIVLDRPNPNGHYIDGPMLKEEAKSFVGMHPVPTVYGMTIGEYGKMINGEKWLENGIQCDLTVISLKNYTHNSEYDLPILPSPNLPNAQSINLYPSLCFFEGTNVSAGRGTEMKFQVFGSPFLAKDSFDFSFTPQPNFGAKHPKHEGEVCFGRDLRTYKKLSSLNLEWLIESYAHTSDKETFFNKFFLKLAGTKELQQQIEAGLSSEEIQLSWQNDLTFFKEVRKMYVLY